MIKIWLLRNNNLWKKWPKSFRICRASVAESWIIKSWLRSVIWVMVAGLIITLHLRFKLVSTDLLKSSLELIIIPLLIFGLLHVLSLK